MNLSRALKVAGWPSSLLHAEKQPVVIDDTQEFAEALLYGAHVDEILVLKDGVRKLGQEHAVPPEIMAAATRECCCRSFLHALAEETLRSLRGRVYCTADGTREEYEMKKRADGSPLDTLLDKRAELEGVPPDDRVYLGEIRKRDKYRHSQDNRWAKTLLCYDVCDWLGRERSRAMPYWDRFDEGIFVGGAFAGSPMHVDQMKGLKVQLAGLTLPHATSFAMDGASSVVVCSSCQVLWSNVGKNFTGYKLLAIWKYGEPSRRLFDIHNYKLFVPPLQEEETEALNVALKVALLGPGDVVVFSGSNAHMAMSISEELSLTAYESFVNLNPTNLQVFLDSGTSAHYSQCRTRQPMLDDIRADVTLSANDLIDDLEDEVLRDEQLVRRAPAGIEVLRHDPAIRSELREVRAKRQKL